MLCLSPPEKSGGAGESELINKAVNSIIMLQIRIWPLHIQWMETDMWKANLTEEFGLNVTDTDRVE